MMGAGNVGNVGNVRNARERPFERVFDAALGLATGVPFVFVTRQRIGLPLCTLRLKAQLRLQLDLHQTLNLIRCRPIKRTT